MSEIPGHLQVIYSLNTYFDLLYASELSADHKLVATVVARTCSYDRKNQMQVSAVTNYAISRVINKSQDTVQKLLEDLVEYGWLFDTGKRIGARKVFTLTFSLIPMGEPKK